MTTLKNTPEISVSFQPLQNTFSLLLKNGVNPATLFEGFPFSYQECKKNKLSLPWSLFIELLHRTEKALGGEEAFVEAIIKDAAKLEGNELMTSLGGFFASPQSLYWVMAKWLGPMGFPFAKFEIEDLPNQDIQVTISLPSELKQTRVFFRAWLGGMIGTPLTFGLPRALVQTRIESHQWTYVISPPLSVTLWARIVRAFRAFFAVRQSVTELIRQQEEIRLQYELRLQEQRKVTEAQVRLQFSEQSAALSKMSALGEMAGGIAHEINNPLALIVLRGQSLQGWLSEQLGDHSHVHNEIEKMVQTTLRISKITRGLLNFSREASKDPIENVSVAAIVRGTLDFCEKKFESAGIKMLTQSLLEDFRVACRPTQISQVLLNLLSNAFDAHQNQSKIQDQTNRWIKIEASEEDQTVCITVSDNGPGIAPEFSEKVFQPFFTTKSVGAGTGLGLCISRGLVEANKGTLSYTSEPGNTQFRVTIPKAHV